MKILRLFTVLGICLWLSGCIFDPLRGWDDGPRHHHHDYDGDGGGRDFCPPGQAKKGNC